MLLLTPAGLGTTLKFHLSMLPKRIIIFLRLHTSLSDSLFHKYFILLMQLKHKDLNLLKPIQKQINESDNKDGVFKTSYRVKLKVIISKNA